MGLIYQIVCNITNERYIGSTSLSLRKRMCYHRHKDSHCSSKQILDRGDYTADILEETELEGIELRKLEQYYMDTMDCINQQRAYITEEQRKQKIKEKNKRNNKRYREKYKDKLNEYDRLYRKYKNSWGGDKRHHNNLLCIDVNLFTV